MTDTTAQTELAWLIEAPGPAYLSAYPMGNGYYFRWDRDANKGLRFCVEAQADMAMMALRSLHPDLFAFASNLPMSRPVQHGFTQ